VRLITKRMNDGCIDTNDIENRIKNKKWVLLDLRHAENLPKVMIFGMASTSEVIIPVMINFAFFKNYNNTELK